MKLRKRMRVMGRALHMELREHKSIFGLCDPAASGDPDDDPADF